MRHPSIFFQINIGIVLEQQGRLEDAEQMYTESLQINLKVFGEDSLNVADAQKDIADVRKAQGWYDEAVKVYTDVLQIQERALGHNHPDVANTKEKYPGAFDCFFLAQWFHGIAICSIGLALHEQSKNSAALVLYQEVLRVRVAVLGPEHPDVAKTKVGLDVLSACVMCACSRCVCSASLHWPSSAKVGCLKHSQAKQLAAYSTATAKLKSPELCMSVRVGTGTSKAAQSLACGGARLQRDGAISALYVNMDLFTVLDPAGVLLISFLW